MKISVLANNINKTIPEVLEYYKMIGVEIPNDENFVFNTELIKKMLPEYNPLENEDKTEFSDTPEENNEVVPIRKEKTEKQKFIAQFYKKNETQLLNEFKEHNHIDKLILEGEYKKVRDATFGFFIYVLSPDGKSVTYPISNEKVDRVFVPTTSLINGKRYLFEVGLAKGSQRERHANPFLLQAKGDNIQEVKQLRGTNQELKSQFQEIKQLGEITKLLKLKEARLQEIYYFLETAELQYKQRTDEINEYVSKSLKEKQVEVNTIINCYNEEIISKHKEVQDKDHELTLLIEKVQESSNNLRKMENLINTLQNRISICRNLQFISEHDENKYFNVLSGKEFKPVDHLDFEKDFEKNFSKLADHIHAFLYHKKNLIYTRHQIRNFLTLLKTHDIIVLSGLSGSGKTQIVNSFAEALGGVAKIIPVKPNWTSSDDLIGYYNPLQMSFLPTPFTEAIVEAINNPNQLYFICLDEMNLARAEYYFADFLSKLEERSKQPEIELYAKHEEELFVSEFYTLLNLIESSIEGKTITTWRDFLENDEARKKFFEMLGNTEKESMLQLHAKMKRRLIDILKYPSTIKIPDNIRFIGAINVDETTHYFSPKILDRIHVVKFDNPLLFEEQVNSWFENNPIEKDLNPVYVKPDVFSERTQYPKINEEGLKYILTKLKEINQNFLLPLNIDFGIRSIRQSINYSNLLPSSFPSIMDGVDEDIPDTSDFFMEQEYFEKVSLNTIIMQKIFPRFIFDGSETARNGEHKIKVVEDFHKFLSTEFNESYFKDESDIGKSSSEYLEEMIKHANRNNSQFNFFA